MSHPITTSPQGRLEGNKLIQTTPSDLGLNIEGLRQAGVLGARDVSRVPITKITREDVRRFDAGEDLQNNVLSNLAGGEGRLLRRELLDAFRQDESLSEVLAGAVDLGRARDELLARGVQTDIQAGAGITRGIFSRTTTKNRAVAPQIAIDRQGLDLRGNAPSAPQVELRDQDEQDRAARPVKVAGFSQPRRTKRVQGRAARGSITRRANRGVGQLLRDIGDLGRKRV